MSGPLPPLFPAPPVPQAPPALPTCTVVIPEGAKPGQMLRITTPSGDKLNVPVPASSKPGQRLRVQYKPSAGSGNSRSAPQQQNTSGVAPSAASLFAASA
eukprot:3899839-Prymnesium_polylepis.1